MENFNAANAIQDLQYFGEFGGVNPSISDSSTYTFLSAKTMFDTFEGNAEGCYLYSRHSSPMNLYLAQALPKWKVQKLPMLPLLEWAQLLLLCFKSVKVETILFLPEQSTEELMLL
jgi:hypothetical protein